MNARLFVLSAACLSVLFSSAKGEEPVSLRYKFSKDRPLIYRSESSVEQSQMVLGQKVETVMTQTDVTLRTLKETTDEGNFRIEAENKRLKVKVKIGPLGEYAFDSTAAEKEAGSALSESLNPVYDRLSGAELTLTLSPRGEVKNVEGYKELLEDVLKENPIGAQFAAGGSDKAAALAYAELYPRLPEKEVQPGDTWEETYDIELPQLGTAKGKRIYKYEGPDKVGDRTTARITLSHELAFDLNIKMDAATVTGKIATEKSSGTIQLDPEKGELISMTFAYTLGGNLTVNANGMEIPVQMSQTQSGTSELLDKLPE